MRIAFPQISFKCIFCTSSDLFLTVNENSKNIREFETHTHTGATRGFGEAVIVTYYPHSDYPLDLEALTHQMSQIITASQIIMGMSHSLCAISLSSLVNEIY